MSTSESQHRNGDSAWRVPGVVVGIALVALLLFAGWLIVEKFNEAPDPLTNLSGTIFLTLMPLSDSVFDLYTLNVLSGTVTAVSSSTDFALMTASYSPDRNKVAYIGSKVHSTGGYNFQVYVRDFSRGEVMSVTSSTSTGATLINSKRLPEWSPNGTRIAYTAQKISERGEGLHLELDPWVILVTDLSGKEEIITSGTQPKWLPSGEALLVLRGDGVYRINLADRSFVKVLGFAQTAGINTQMDLSADGALFAVTNLAAQAIDMYDVTSQNPFTVEHRMTLFGEGGKAFWPVFSPNGEYLAALWIDRTAGTTHVVVYETESFRSKKVAELYGFNLDASYLTDWR